MPSAFQTLVLIAVGSISGLAGKPKGVPAGGFSPGFFLSLLGILIVALMPRGNEAKAEQA